jgi:hypothetical protein
VAGFAVGCGAVVFVGAAVAWTVGDVAGLVAAAVGETGRVAATVGRAVVAGRCVARTVGLAGGVPSRRAVGDSSPSLLKAPSATATMPSRTPATTTPTMKLRISATIY